MKRLLIFLLSIFITQTSCNAITYEVSNKVEYKIKIEKKIHNEIPKIKRKIDKEFVNAEKTYNKYLKDKNKKENINEYIFIMQDYQRGIETSDVLFIYSLIQITNDYITIKSNVPATDNAETLLEYIEPYFKSNNINYSELNNLKIYKNDKINKIDSFIH